MSDVTRMLRAVENGDAQAAGELLPLVYDELRRLAAQQMAHEKPGQTLQTTALVHEAYLRLVREEDRQWHGSRHFYFAAAEAMRRILIENARRKQRERHGGDLVKLSLDLIDPAAPMPDANLLALNEALAQLTAEDPEAARLVELRFFAGLGHQQAAEIMGINRGAADGLWAYARAWLYDAMTAR